MPFPNTESGISKWRETLNHNIHPSHQSHLIFHDEKERFLPLKISEILKSTKYHSAFIITKKDFINRNEWIRIADSLEAVKA